ncbi:MAG: hypothetical protein HUJ25_06845 [Crocinitomicaceae bacterium]|nr:hypothetical protein [Crocinitomicaceae bacterium]
MKNVKINLDRPPVDSKSIQAQKDFDGLLKNHAMMSKPFYKSPWFIGATGLASVSIIVGGIVAFSPENDSLTEEVNLPTDAPPEYIAPDNQLIAMNSEVDAKEKTNELVKKTFQFSKEIQNTVDDKTNTLDQNSTNNQSEELKSSSSTEEIQIKEADLSVHSDKHQETSEDESISALMPRIGGKINGSISREELFDNKGITTESDVNVIHFELHLIDGLGGEAFFEEESNQLNEEMKAALDKRTAGETIYFENIKGKTEDGNIVRLNPLRYVLMN